MVTLLGGAGFAVPAAAEPVTVPASGNTPAKFEGSCFDDGGQPFEIHDAGGGVAMSVCEYSDGTFNECNWGAGTCTYGAGTRVQPPLGPLDDVIVDRDDLNGVVDEGTSPPAATEPPAEPTAQPTIEPTPQATGESTTEPPAGETDESATEPADDDAQATDVPTAEATARAGSTGDPGSAGGSAADAQSTQAASGQESASLTIVSFVCEAGYDPFALDAAPGQDCSEPADGVPFALTGNESDMTRSAGDDGAGTATFQELAPGVYRLAGQPPSWGGVAFVHDCVSSVRSFDDAAFFPVAMVGPTGTLRLTLLPGEVLECGWYQVAAGS